MESTTRTAIHLGVANRLGTVGIQCTSHHLYVYQHRNESGELAQINWDWVHELRLNVKNNEIKLTLTHTKEQIVIKLMNPQVLVNQICKLGCLVKVTKWKPNLYGNVYYKPSGAIKQEAQSVINGEDFQEHMKIARIAQEWPAYIAHSSKSTFCDMIASIFDNIF